MILKNWRRFGVAAIVGALALTGCAGSPTDEKTTEASSSVEASDSKAPELTSVKNCGRDVKVKPYSKVVTLNQGATEVVLALGLQDKLVGTAYLDSSIPEKWKAAYDSVKVLSKKYPDKETFLAAKPDFAMASYSSAFGEKGVGSREELAKKGIETFIDPFACPKGTPSVEPSFENIYEEFTNVAALLGAPEAAEKLIADSKAKIEEVEAKAAGKGKKVLWFDSGDKTPFVGAGKGGPQIIMDAVGATNIFADLDGGWADGSWEKVVAANPDVIVLANAEWSTADKKKKYLESDPVLKNLDAVKNKKYVVVDFAASTPGARLVDGAVSLSDQLSS